MDWEYVALTWNTEGAAECNIQFMAAKGVLVSEGWEEYVRAGRVPMFMGGACIMRRPKDEPRMWTEGEIKAIFEGWERMTTRRQELQKRNEELQGRLSEWQETILVQTLRIGELQTAIDEVVGVSSGPPSARYSTRGTMGASFQAVHDLLYPLATKEETNG